MFVKTVCIHHSNKTVTGRYANKLENHQNKIKKKKYHLFSIFTNHKILLKKMYFIVLSST